MGGRFDGRVNRLETGFAGRAKPSPDDDWRVRQLALNVFLADGESDLPPSFPVPKHPDGTRVTLDHLRKRFEGRLKPDGLLARLLSNEPDRET